jgi:Flp pilus assembly protein TadD
MNAGAYLEKDGRWITGAALILALLGTALLLIFAVGFARTGERLLSRLEVSVGEILMNDGIRFELAGEIENAKAAYLLALESRFEGSQNRAATLRNLGVLLWLEQDYENALTYLRQAVEIPEAPVSTYTPLCDVLFHFDLGDEILELLPSWRAAAIEAENSEALSDSYYYEGRVLLQRGDDAAAQAAFLKGVEHFAGSRNASELAYIYYREERYEEALKYADQYLSRGTNSERAVYTRDIRTACAEKLSRNIPPAP